MSKSNPVEGTSTAEVIALNYNSSSGSTVTTGDDWIFAYGGDDIVFADAGNDRVYGGEGNDTVYGGAGRDRLYGDEGDDELRGGADSDWLWGGVGDDMLYGDEGNDILRAGSGNDTLFGGIGNDKLYGNKGNNELYGGDGEDFISSGDQASTLDGGADDDTLAIRMKKGGDHVATGGTGADEFQFLFAAKSAISDSVITDFELGVDGFSVDGVDDALYMSILALTVGEAAVTDQGGSALLTLTTGDSILFEGITESAFEAFYGL